MGNALLVLQGNFYQLKKLVNCVITHFVLLVLEVIRIVIFSAIPLVKLAILEENVLAVKMVNL